MLKCFFLFRKAGYGFGSMLVFAMIFPLRSVTIEPQSSMRSALKMQGSRWRGLVLLEGAGVSVVGMRTLIENTPLMKKGRSKKTWCLFFYRHRFSEF